MAPSAPGKPPEARVIPPKLARLPKHAQIRKRPLLHAAVPSPYASSAQQKVVYISPHTSFFSATKRVRHLLSEIDKRATGPLSLLEGRGSDKQKLRKLSEQVENGQETIAGRGQAKRDEEVVLKATGRAIEKALGLGLYFQGQSDVMVRIRTGSVGAIDDITEREDRGREGEEPETKEGDLPESRIRHVSVVEIAITLR